MKTVFVFGNDSIQLTAGDIDLPFAQLLVQQRLGNALVMVLVENEALQGRAEMGAV